MNARPRKEMLLRLDPALHALVQRLADGELRSTNAQVEILLREALRARGALAGASAADDTQGESSGRN